MLLERSIQVEERLVRSTAPRRQALRRRIPWIAALLTLGLHVAANPHYGFFRDELYFIICGRHPALGYVDQPSLVPLLAALSQVFGVSLFALRIIPAVCAALSTYVACLFVAELGGGVFALILTALVAAVSPVLMAFGGRLSPDSIEFCTWPLIALLVLRIVKGANPRWWLAVGAVVAVAGWSKYSVAFFAVALLAGLLVTPERRVLRSWWFAAGAALAVVLLLPNFAWQWIHEFPMIQLLRNDYGKFLLKNPPFPLQQIMIMSPLLSTVWIVGVIWLLWQRRTRFLGYAYIVLIGIMWAFNAKNYYPAAVYPYLIAAGTVPIEQWTRFKRRWRAAIVGIIIAFAIPSTPFVLPVLPMRTYIAYQEFLGRLFNISFHVDKGATNANPIQYYADMTGWPELAQTVASVYNSLPAQDRARTAIYTHNFGEASSIDVFGGQYGLPTALSGNNNYWIWGPQGYDGHVLIDVNGNEAFDRARYRSVKLVGVFHNRYGMPYENDLRIYVCRDPKYTLGQIWPRLKNYSYAFGGL